MDDDDYDDFNIDLGINSPKDDKEKSIESVKKPVVPPKAAAKPADRFDYLNFKASDSDDDQNNSKNEFDNYVDDDLANSKTKKVDIVPSPDYKKDAPSYGNNGPNIGGDYSKSFGKGSLTGSRPKIGAGTNVFGQQPNKDI